MPGGVAGEGREATGAEGLRLTFCRIAFPFFDVIVERSTHTKQDVVCFMARRASFKSKHENVWTVQVAVTNEVLDAFKSESTALAFAKYTLGCKALSSLVIVPPPSAFGKFPYIVTPTFGFPSVSVDDYKKLRVKEKKDKEKPPSEPKPKPK